MNTAATFAILGAGGLLLTKAVTGSSWGAILQGNPGQVQSSSIAELASVAGAGQAIAGAAPSSLDLGSGSATLPSSARGYLSRDQQTFASRLAADTGLDPGVVAAWVHAEQPPTGPAPNGVNNWLNIGSTDSGFFGGSNPAWASPITAADETAKWLAGSSAAGFGAASGGIRSILSTAGKSPGAQIAAIQGSGWASSGYPDLPSIYRTLTGK